MLGKIEHLSALHHRKEYGEFVSFLGEESCTLNKHSDKVKFHYRMMELHDLRMKGSIKDVLNFVFANFFDKPKKIKEFENTISQIDLDDRAQKNKQFYDALMQVPYIEVTMLYDFI